MEKDIQKHEKEKLERKSKELNKKRPPPKKEPKEKEKENKWKDHKIVLALAGIRKWSTLVLMSEYGGSNDHALPSWQKRQPKIYIKGS